MTPHVLDQLPLWVEGDLSTPELAAVEAHLAQCTACRLAATELQASQSWLRETLASPFDASDQERLRRSVMEQIKIEPTPKPVRRFATRPALLAACAAVLIIATFSWRQTQPVAPAPTLASPSLPADPPVPGAITPTLAPSAPVRAAPAREALPPMKVPVLPREEPARIELQTADPTVRIIWLAQAKPLSEPTAITPEAP